MKFEQASKVKSWTTIRLKNWGARTGLKEAGTGVGPDAGA
jgi:hypothetical protein